MPTPRHLIAGAIALLAGFGLAVSAVTARGFDLRAGGSASLRDLVIRQAEHLNAEAAAAEALRKAVNQLAVQRGGPDLTDARGQELALTSVAGFTAVHGPGMTVTLDDAPKDAASTSVDPDALVIHQQDVQAVVNAMWRGGADAVMVMDQRLISTSAVKCVGNTLLLQGHVYSPPFVIKAIGDTSRLQRALDSDPGVQLIQDFARVYGLGYATSQEADIHMPAFSGAVSMPQSQTQ